MGVVSSHQQTTVEEQSHIMQLEEELRLRRAEIENLQAQLRGSDTSSQQANNSDAAAGSGAQPETLLLREQLVSAGREHYKESSELKEKYETALAACQQETDSLKAMVDNKNQEISEMKQKVQQATKENMEMMDTWKVFFYIPFNRLQVVQRTSARVVGSIQWSSVKSFHEGMYPELVRGFKGREQYIWMNLFKCYSFHAEIFHEDYEVSVFRTKCCSLQSGKAKTKKTWETKQG